MTTEDYVMGVFNSWGGSMTEQTIFDLAKQDGYAGTLAALHAACDDLVTAGTLVRREDGVLHKPVP